MKRIIIFLNLLLISFLGKTQNQEITGIITAFNKFPLKNVKVIAKKAKNVAITDEKGTFKIEVKKNDILSIEAEAFVSYKHRVKAADRSVNINLIYENKKKNKEIVLNAGYIRENDLEYGLENLIAANSVFSNFTDVFDAVKHALTGTTLIIENGERRVQIRGGKTLTGSNAALTIVDGVIVMISVL